MQEQLQCAHGKDEIERKAMKEYIMIPRRGNLLRSSHELTQTNAVQKSESVPNISTGVGLQCIEQSGFGTDESVGSQTRQNSLVSGGQNSSVCEKIQQESNADEVEEQNQEFLAEVGQKFDALSFVLNDTKKSLRDVKVELFSTTGERKAHLEKLIRQ